MTCRNRNRTIKGTDSRGGHVVLRGYEVRRGGPYRYGVNGRPVTAARAGRVLDGLVGPQTYTWPA